MIKLEELRKDRSITIGEGRTAQNFAAHLASVLQAPSWNARIKLAPLNGSVINKPLIPISFDRVLLPVLHIVLGIVKKIWDNLVKCIQALELKQCKEISMLKEAHENLACHLSNLMEKKELPTNEYKTAEKQCKDTYKMWIDAKAEQPRLSLEINELQQQYMAALSRQKVADAARKQINSRAFDAYSKLVDDMASFVKTKQGPIEHALEWTVASYPISAKHKPYYGGAFNGNDCIQLLTNVFDIFRNVQEAAASTEARELRKIRLLLNFKSIMKYGRLFPV